ncbi:glycosyltransferase family 4 protein [Halorubrum miltondacostae]|uniref:Glycosyltransferase family 4 protein n=1 Tax=Halorubrum miltondacostae TaxID=3076378 RepID=A0ABD5M5Y4_9EURY
MDILQVSKYFKPAWQSGGVARYCYEVSRALQERGHTVSVYTTDKYIPQDTRRDDLINVDGIKTRYFENRSDYMANNFRITTPSALPSIIRANIDEFDIIHIHEHRSSLAAIVFYYANKTGVPYVIHEHGSLPYDRGNKYLKYGFDLPLGRKIVSEAASMLALNEDEANAFQKWGIKNCRINIVPNGVRVEETSLKGEVRLHERDHLELLYIGRISERKGIDILLDAVSQLKNINLKIAGPDDGYLKQMKMKMSNMNSNNNIEYLGFISEEKKRKLYVNSDVLILPSLYGEGFPTTILEAASFGTPTIASTACNVNFLGDYDAGLIIEPDTEALIDALLKLQRDDELLRKMKRRSKEVIQEEYSWSDVSGQLENLYQDIVHKE